MKSKMIVDNYESASKARPRTALLNEAFAEFPENERLMFECHKARSGFSIWVEYNSEVYPTFDDLNKIIRTTSISFRKAKREAALDQQ